MLVDTFWQNPFGLALHPGLEKLAVKWQFAVLRYHHKDNFDMLR